jgi:hypothetical protein
MKAILGNFEKISETEFHLNKDMQFAQISLTQEGAVQTVRYKDKQNIEVSDILTHEDTDYEIISINADDYLKLQVKVKAIIQEQNVPDKTDFVPRKMTPRKPKIEEPIKEDITPNVIKTENDIPLMRVTLPKPDDKKEPTKKIGVDQPKPNKRNIFKRIAGWISNKLSSYSNS